MNATLKNLNKIDKQSAIVRRAHSEYIIAWISVYASLLVIAMSFTSTNTFAVVGLFIVGAIGNAYATSKLRKATNRLAQEEETLQDLSQSQS